jgi:hypothetical protein
MEWILLPPYEMANQRICNSRVMPCESSRKPLAKERYILFSKLNNWIWNLVPFSIKLWFKTSKVDQELECEMHQTKYKVMIECNMDLRPMMTTHIVRSCYEEW